MDHMHPGNSDPITTLRSVIEASVAAGFERYIGESLHVRIEREVDAALDKRLASPHRHSNAQSNVTVPSTPGIEPIGEADRICQPTISTAPSKLHSQRVAQALPADSVRSAAPEEERRPLVSKPARWNIVDLTDILDELPEKSLDVTSSIEHGVADMGDSPMPGEQGDESDNIAGEEVPDHEAAALRNGSKFIQEALTATQKRSFEATVQRGPIADLDINPPKGKRPFDSIKSASEEVESYDSRETVMVAPPVKRARQKTHPPGYSTGPAIRFLKVCSQLTAAPNRRGWPRIVDLKDFMEESNRQNLTMADIVATILWKHGPRTLETFLDFEGHPEFHFERREAFLKVKECWISRYLDQEGVVTVACGRGSLHYSPERAWDAIRKASFTCRVSGNGRWELATSCEQSSQRLQSSVVKLGTELFFEKVWKESKYADITIS